MTTSEETRFIEDERENWLRGIHEGGHAVATWAVGGQVERIGVRETMPERLDDHRHRAVVAAAGDEAERLVGNDSPLGCGRDRRCFDAAIEAIRAEEGDAAAEIAEQSCRTRAAEIVSTQEGAVRAFGFAVGKLIHRPSFTRENILGRDECAAIARAGWVGPFPPDTEDYQSSSGA